MIIRCNHKLHILRESLARQKCHTRWQRVRWGNIAVLKSISLAFVGIKFLSLIRTPIFWPAILQIMLMCSEKFSLESIVTPNNLRESVILISWLFNLITWVVLLSLWPCPMFIVWYFFKFPARRFELYQLVACCALSFSINITEDWSRPVL